jgi:dTMP kinase
MGTFISLDGPDGGGKTTQICLLYEELERRGFPVTRTREPGGTALGERIRNLLLDPVSQADPVTEALMYAAARAQLVSRVIRPALEEGQVVLVERFYHSSIAYQSYGSGVSLNIIRALAEIATGGLTPDLTLILDISPEIVFSERIVSRPLDRIEGRGLQFHRRVREGFLALAADEPGRLRVIDATSSVREVHERVLRAVESLLGKELGGEVR